MKLETQLMDEAILTDQQPARRRGRPPKHAAKAAAKGGSDTTTRENSSTVHQNSELNGLIDPKQLKRRGRPPKGEASKTSVEKDGDDASDELPATVHPRNQLNDLTAREWIPETVSVWNQRGLGAGHSDAQIERQHPAPFSFTDVGRLIRFFTKKGHTVLDPFVGVGSTLKACAIDARHGIGIELNSDFAELSRRRLATEVRDMFSTVDEQSILEGDARDHLPTIPDESVDFVVTSPPYWSILKKEDHKVRQERLEKGLAKDYGTDARDLAKIESYDEFLRELAAIFGECARTLRRGRYMAIIVSDFRDKSKYIMFHADLARALETYGLEMRGLKVLYQRHKKVFPYGYPYSYVPNIHNQYILILQKPK
ncbi:DNA methyltransferase [Achromobacter xylosoxidans]|uniref:DNA methyltransferase n=1 Tax=Alcaligenes xylosoxydans xylosoxydans TaxID=85698 RepID=UPI001A9521C8|nr:DNA methyltransferase [Achromobacter xylosoxidans]